MNYTERIEVPGGTVIVTEVMRGTWTVSEWRDKPRDYGAGRDRVSFRVLNRKADALRTARGIVRNRWRQQA